jgi:hypothetical protein
MPLVHRDYRMPGHIEIMVTSSSIKISNPGGLVEEVQHRVEQGSIESEIRRGRRGIKDYPCSSAQAKFCLPSLSGSGGASTPIQ